MLQDMPYGRLENEFRTLQPQDGDPVVCIRGDKVLVARDENDALTLPTFAQMKQWASHGTWRPWDVEREQYVFRLLDQNYFLWMGEAGESEDPAFAYESIKPLRQITSKHICFAIMTAWHLYVWYRDNRWCGRCGAPTVHDNKERMLRCPHCGNMIFPKIAPAVIVAVTNGERILMTKYANRGHTRYALIAGFVEIGETGEQCVAREVMEEVGLKVKNIRYYKTQPWGVESDLLLGYFCDLDGEDTITLDESELAMAGWYPRDDMPAQDDGISLTREMMRVFAEGKEPK